MKYRLVLETNDAEQPVESLKGKRVCGSLRIFREYGTCKCPQYVFLPIFPENLAADYPQAIVIEMPRSTCLAALIPVSDERGLQEVVQRHRGQIVEPQKNLVVDALAVETVVLASDSAAVSGIELPSCPTCIERLDRLSTGISLLNCDDIYHHCCSKSLLDQWPCAVCQLIHTNSKTKPVFCADCYNPDDGWICLICANVGCGRYKGGHAHGHFEKLGHAFALQLTTRYIWDYREDRYVHRTCEASGSDVRDGNDEITYAQLESQRLYFDTKMSAMDEARAREIGALNAKFAEEASSWREKSKEMEQTNQRLLDAKMEYQKRAETVRRELEKLRLEWEAENAMGKGLAGKVDALEKELATMCAAKADLEDQVSDLLKHLETVQLVQQTGNDPDIVQGKIIVAAPNHKSSRPSRARK